MFSILLFHKLSNVIQVVVPYVNHAVSESIA